MSDTGFSFLHNPVSFSCADSFDQSWTLDGLGNFGTFDDDGDSQTRTANAVNEISAITGGWITPAYDAAGNMKFGPKPGDETTGLHYVYDAWNRLVAVYEDDGDEVFEPGTGDDSVATYEYDGTKRRIEKTFADDTGVEYYYNQQWQMLEERAVDDEGTPTAINQYVWSARYIDAPVVRFHDANADGDVLDEGDNTRYYTTDANYNVTATIDAATGDVAERYVYTPYGTATVYSPTWTNPAAPATDGPLYCGYFLDAESGLYHVRNRYYDGSLSTFISRDPIGFIAGDANWLRYVRNAPTVSVDPTGMQAPGIGCMSPIAAESWEKACHQGGEAIGRALEQAELYLPQNMGHSPGGVVYMRYEDWQSAQRRRCLIWARMQEEEGLGWLEGLPDCPCSINVSGNTATAPNGWEPPSTDLYGYHPKAKWCMRSSKLTSAGAGQQCCYDYRGLLITDGESAGTPDRFSPSSWPGKVGHLAWDVRPFDWCKYGGLVDVYLKHRPPNRGPKDKPCPPLRLD